jgi:hypothetical protein
LALDTILFLVGSVLAVAAIGIIVYNGIPERSDLLRIEPALNKLPMPQINAVKDSEQPQITEAPSSFPVEKGLTISNNAPLPTDSTALAATSSFLVISPAKSARRNRSKITSKRQIPRINEIPSSLGTPLQAVKDPDKKGGSSAT